MIVDRLIKLTLIEGGKYERGEYVGNYIPSVSGNSVILEESEDTMLYKLSPLGKTVYYHGYTESDIILMGDNVVIDTIPSPIMDIEIKVPENCKYIYFPVQKEYEDEYNLRVFDGESYDCSDFVDNTDSLEVIYSRDNTSGVLSEVSMEFDFVLDARTWLRDIFREKGLYSKVVFTVYRRDDFSNTYTMVKSMNLDFGTYQLTSDRVKISAASDTLLEIINSAGKTDYDVKVSEVRNEKKWEYGRTGAIGSATYEITDVGIVSDFDKVVVPYIGATDTEHLVDTIYYQTQELSLTLPVNDNSFFAENISTKNQDIYIDLDVKIHIEATGDGREIEDYERKLIATIATWDDNDNLVSNTPYAIPIFAFQGSITQKASITYRGEYSFHGAITVLPGHKVTFCFLNKGSNLEFAYITLSEASFSAYNKSVSETTANIDVIDPNTLFQKYLDLMSGESGMYTSKIFWDEGDYQIKIVAAESIRGLNGAVIHGKPNDFINWMRVLGYEYEITGRTITFKRRDEFFNNSVIMTMNEDEVADLVESADEEYAYTSVEIGYEKQDYNKESGRIELNGLFTYTTEYVSREDNKLSLISPYRADAMGIEFLVQETLDSSTDDESDNDIFFVALVENDEYYGEYKGVVIYDTAYGIELFNGVFAPPFLVERNMSLIGINTSMLYFKSTDMNRNARIGGNSWSNPYTDHVISKKLFKPLVYNFASGNHKEIPHDRSGIIEVKWQGEVYRGFIREIRKNYAKETETTWELYACDAKREGTLEVTPQLLWITPSSPGTFHVTSDTNWVINY